MAGAVVVVLVGVLGMGVLTVGLQSCVVGVWVTLGVVVDGLGKEVDEKQRARWIG